MASYRFTAFFIIVGILIGSCNSKQGTTTGEEPSAPDDFIALYRDVQLPYQPDLKWIMSDDKKLQKQKDSLLVKHRIFSRFVPDSILSGIYGKDTALRIYTMGKVKGPAGEHYLFTGIRSRKNTGAALIIVFNKKDKFIAALPVWRTDQDPGKITETTVTLDKKFAVNKAKTRSNADGSSSEGKDIYAFSQSSGDFQLILTEALDDKPTELINPIDTLPKKNKVSADYISGKMNMVSIRDGRKADRLTFFIHFEKNNGECTGELKGEAMIKSPTRAEYRVGGDPCILQFQFTSSAVTLKEEEGCGSHRGLRCAFDGNFARKKEVKPKKK